MATTMTRATLGLGIASVLLLCGCVTTGTHEAAIAAEKQKQAELQKQLDDTAAKLATTEQERADCSQKADDLKGKKETCDNQLNAAMSQNSTLVEKVNSMGQNVELLLGEKDQLDTERQRLKAELADLKRMRDAAEARNAEFKKLLGRLHNMIDSGSLEVQIRNGLMVVRMSSDVLFPPGSAKLKPAAEEAIRELAQTIAQFPDRKFQVVGHSDSTPIKSARFPSNWELSSQRAIEVVRVMVDAGVPPQMLSAAGQAEFDPLAGEETEEEKAQNRRVEVVFVPKIDEMPGFDKILNQ